MIRTVPAPWLREGERDRWIKPSQFAKLVMRSPKTVYHWLNQGDVLSDFGYRAFRDVRGQWRIQVRRSDLLHLHDEADTTNAR
jgi:hypothetical protein